MAGDPHWASVVCLAGFEDATPFVTAEQSPLAQTVSYPSSMSSFRSGISKFGNYSFQLDTIGGFNVPYNAAFLSGTTPFTVEFWGYLHDLADSGTRDVCGQWGQTVGAWWLQCNHTATLIKYFRLAISTDGGNTADATVFTHTALDLAAETWHHFALDFDGTDYRLFANGVLAEKVTAAHSIYASSLPMFFGGRTDGGTVSTWGGGARMLVDDVRITVGTARYASDSSFSVPTAPYPTDGTDPDWADVVLRWDFETTTVTDESDIAAVGGVGQRTNTVAGSSAQSKFGTQSLLLEGPDTNAAGLGGSILFPPNTAYAVGTGAWTAEGWFRFTSAAIATTTWFYLFQCINRSGNVGWAVDTYDNGDGTWAIGYEGNGNYSSYGSGFTPFVADTWYHIAADFDGTDYRFYVDGTMVQKDTGYITTGDSGAPLAIGGQLTNEAWGGYNANDANSMGGYVDEFRLTVGVARYASDGGFTVPVAAYERGPEGSEPIDETITESMALDDAADDTAFLLQVAAETITMSAPLVVVKPFELASSADFTVGSEEFEFLRRVLATLTDSTELSDTVTTLAGVLVRDQVTMSRTVQPGLVRQLTIAQSMELREALFFGLPASIVESVVADATALAEAVVQVIEALQISALGQGSALYGRTITETVDAFDTLARFFGGDIIEGIETADTLAATLSASDTVAETVELTAAVSPLFVLRTVASESIELTAEEAMQMLFAPTVVEGVELTGGHFAPDGSFTTWAMNTTTGAVTEYEDYVFNSFGQVGGRYVGASATGLYELYGDDDEGTSIATRIRGGFMQFGGTRLSRLKEAYIAARGEGDFVLRIITGDGATYDYATSTRDMRSTKVHMGKGQRARYFAFELISTDGHDFDLDTLEFVPIVVQRRV